MMWAQAGGTAVQDLGIIDVDRWYGSAAQLGQDIRSEVVQEDGTLYPWCLFLLEELYLSSSFSAMPEALLVALARAAATLIVIKKAQIRHA